jgi:GMP synthase (glutamine-hydrolysing)
VTPGRRSAPGRYFQNLLISLNNPGSAKKIHAGTKLALPITMNVLVVQHVNLEGPGLIEECLREKKIAYQIICLEKDPHLPSPDGFTHIVLLGGPMNVYEENSYPFLRAEDLLIKEAIQRGKYILGICLGAQLIAKALGAAVYKAPRREIGWYNVSLTEEGLKDALFSSLPQSFPVFQWHEDTFEIPRGGRPLASSTPVLHQAFRYENAYGLQFHLEVTREMILEWMKEYQAGIEQSRIEILTHTEKNFETYRKRGTVFFGNLLKQCRKY